MDSPRPTPRRNCRTSCGRTRRCSTVTAGGITSRRTATCGSRRSRSAGGRITRDRGDTRATAGRGMATTAGRTRRIITAAGASPAARGTGFLRTCGARRGCPGVSPQATSAGRRSGGTTAPPSASIAVAIIRRIGQTIDRGEPGRSCPAITSHRGTTCAPMRSTAHDSMNRREQRWPTRFRSCQCGTRAFRE